MCIRDRNQNVTGLALTIFGTGFGNFFGGSISKLAGGVGQISVKVTGSAYTAKIPGLSEIPVIGDLFFSYGFMTYLCIIAAVVLSVFLFKTRYGLNLRAIGEKMCIRDRHRSSQLPHRLRLPESDLLHRYSRNAF